MIQHYSICVASNQLRSLLSHGLGISPRSFSACRKSKCLTIAFNFVINFVSSRQFQHQIPCPITTRRFHGSDPSAPNKRHFASRFAYHLPIPSTILLEWVSRHRSSIFLFGLFKNNHLRAQRFCCALARSRIYSVSILFIQARI